MSPVKENEPGFNKYVYNLFNKASFTMGDGYKKPNIDGVARFVSNDNNNCVVECKKGYYKNSNKNTCNDCLDEDRKGTKTYVTNTCTATATNGCYGKGEPNTNFPYLPGDEGPVAELVQDLKNCSKPDEAKLDVCFNNIMPTDETVKNKIIKERNDDAIRLENQISKGYIYAYNGDRNSTVDGGYCYNLCTTFLRNNPEDKSECLVCENARLPSDNKLFNQVGIDADLTEKGKLRAGSKDLPGINPKIYLDATKRSEYIDGNSANSQGLGTFLGGAPGWNKCEIVKCPDGSAPIYNIEKWNADNIPSSINSKFTQLGLTPSKCSTSVTTNCIDHDPSNPLLIATATTNTAPNESSNKANYLLDPIKIAKLRADIKEIRDSFTDKNSQNYLRYDQLYDYLVNFKEFNNITLYNNLLTICKNCWEMNDDIVMIGSDKDQIYKKADYSDKIVFFQPAESFDDNTCTIKSCDNGYKLDSSTNRCIKKCEGDFEYDEETETTNPLKKANVCKVKCPSDSVWVNPETTTSLSISQDNTFYEKIRNFDESISLNPIKASCKWNKEVTPVNLKLLFDTDQCDKSDEASTRTTWYIGARKHGGWNEDPGKVDNCVINKIFDRHRGLLKVPASIMKPKGYIGESDTVSNIKKCAQKCGDKQKQTIAPGQPNTKLKTCEVGFSYKPWADCWGNGASAIQYEGKCFPGGDSDEKAATWSRADYKKEKNGTNTAYQPMYETYPCWNYATWTYIRKDMSDIDNAIRNSLVNGLRNCPQSKLKLISVKNPTNNTCETGYTPQIVEKRLSKKIDKSVGINIIPEKICNSSITAKYKCVKEVKLGEAPNYELARKMVHEWMDDTTTYTQNEGTETLYWSCQLENNNRNQTDTLSEVIKGKNYESCEGGSNNGQIQNYSGTSFSVPTSPQ